MFVLGVIPARGGSKGVPGKNIRLLAGKPLITYSIERASGSTRIDRTIVSTDDEEIARVASKHGADVPFRRPQHLATDTASMADVLKHSVTWMETEGGVERVDFIACMQPTSPFGTPGDLDRAVQLVLDHEDADAVMSVCEVDHTPYYLKKIVDERLTPLMPDDDPLRPLLNRQQAPITAYRPAGVVSVTRRDILMVGNLRYGVITLPLILSQEDSVNIDQEIDFVVAESILAETGTTDK